VKEDPETSKKRINQTANSIAHLVDGLQPYEALAALGAVAQGVICTGYKIEQWDTILKGHARLIDMMLRQNPAKTQDDRREQKKRERDAFFRGLYKQS
jgi:hypothetical protein